MPLYNEWPFYWDGGPYNRRRGALVDHHMTTNWPNWPWRVEMGGPCVLPTIEVFRARFPEFAEISDQQIAMAMEDAACWADGTWMTRCCDCARAILYLTAHFLALQKIAAAAMCSLPDCKPTIKPGDGGTIIEGGQVTSLRFESMSASFSSAKFAAEGASAAASGSQPYNWSSTPYGQIFRSLLKVNQPAVVVV